MVQSTAAAASATPANELDVPKKLRDDAIVEAVCQFQFQTADLPELVIGRLTLGDAWAGFSPNRLPFADIPAPVRSADQNLKTQAIFELRNADGSRTVRMNEGLISYHIVGVHNYCGWSAYRQELDGVVRTICQKLKTPEIKRISLRYINALHPTRHHIGSVHELNLEVRVGGAKIDGPINLNYAVRNGAEHVTTTRIAHKSFVQGTLPDNTSAIVDVEVTTPPKFSGTSEDAVRAWIEAAHTFEKQAFFKLIPPNVLAKLREE